MQHDVVAEFFTRLVILIVLLMMLSVIAIPEIVSMIEESWILGLRYFLLNTEL